MPVTLVNPMNETAPSAAVAAPRLSSLQGRTIALLDISKPGGSVFLDRMETLLKERYGVAAVIREMKPTFAKPAPDAVIDKIRGADQRLIAEDIRDKQALNPGKRRHRQFQGQKAPVVGEEQDEFGQQELGHVVGLDVESAEIGFAVFHLPVSRAGHARKMHGHRQEGEGSRFGGNRW